MLGICLRQASISLRLRLCLVPESLVNQGRHPSLHRTVLTAQDVTSGVQRVGNHLIEPRR